jgi:hypothetical protein
MRDDTARIERRQKAGSWMVPPHSVVPANSALSDLHGNATYLHRKYPRVHPRQDVEAALRSRSIESANFESHLAMFDLGMPPHGGFAIGLERLTCHVLSLPNVRQAVL